MLQSLTSSFGSKFPIFPHMLGADFEGWRHLWCKKKKKKMVLGLRSWRTQGTARHDKHKQLVLTSGVWATGLQGVCKSGKRWLKERGLLLK